jgi:HAD superfamily hydrolase (TIGR01509 family)
MTPGAILFDLYGTLVKAGSRPLSRRLPEALGVPRAAWLALLRGGLLTRPFADDAAFASFVGSSLAPDRAAEAASTCAGLLHEELEGVSLVPGARSLLTFLRRRGMKLGLVSNVASPFKIPVAALGLAESFDAAAYSCDEGVAKPDPEIYRRVLERLGTDARRALFVGDNAPNDVRAPAALGMRTAGVGVAGADVSLGAVADLGLLDLAASPFAVLLGPGDVVELGGARWRVASIAPVADSEQGRYNLVYGLDVVQPDGVPATLYAKRFLLPETVHVEQFAYRLQALTGLPCCAAAVRPGSEGLLILSEAPGRKWEHDLSVETAYALGGHFVFALLFSNADIRPRNAFVENGRVTLVDLEHCFFNLAIDVSGLAAPERPETFDRLPAGELAARIKKRVLSARATSRARRSFFADTPKGSRVDEAFHAGFLDFYRMQQGRADELAGVLRARVHAEPPLVIGTHGYRRALANVDVADICARLATDAQVAYETTW